jgi:hypothetical protein
MNQLPRDQGSPPVADKDEQEQGANEGQPIAIGLLTDLLPGQLTDVVPKELEQILNAARVPLQLAGANHDQGQQGANHHPRAQENLAVDSVIAKLPVEVLTNLQFGKGKDERHWSQQWGVQGRKRDGTGRESTTANRQGRLGDEPPMTVDRSSRT